MRVSAIIAIVMIIFIFSINIMSSFEQKETRYDYNDITYTLMKLNSLVILLRRITALI
jgi:succinate dehydrogenase hydrophobic anchor subunit